MDTNNSIRVWVRALGNSCRLRVDSLETARWLLDRLVEQNARLGEIPIEIQTTDSGCRFQIPNESQTLAALESTLGQIPGVEVMLSPETTDNQRK